MSSRLWSGRSVRLIALTNASQVLAICAGLCRRYFDAVYDTVHIDEKWFCIFEVSSRYILAEDEDPPHLTCHNKRFITKVMFLAAVARLRYDYANLEGFDGKIGIFPLVTKHEAMRTTKTRRTGHDHGPRQCQQNGLLQLPRPTSATRHQGYVAKYAPCSHLALHGVTLASHLYRP
jgi:hypothetical protein